MVEVGLGRPGLGVVSDEDDRIESLVETLHHRQRLGRARDQGGPRIEGVGHDIAHAAVSIVDHDGPGSGGPQPLEYGVDVLRHPAAGRTVIGRRRVDLVAVDHTPDAFHVHRNVDLGPGLLGGKKDCRAEKDDADDGRFSHVHRSSLIRRARNSTCEPWPRKPI